MLSPAAWARPPEQAQGPNTTATGTPDKTCLVLSGGGARGFAHVGVLKVIDELRIPIGCVVGTSMGAVVGSLYASGFSGVQIEKMLLDVDWTELADDRPDREELSPTRKRDDYNYPLGLDLGIKGGQLKLSTGLVNGARFELLLQKLLASASVPMDFDRMPIPFRAVAADIETGEPVVLSDGRLLDAVRASMSVPGLFNPVPLNGRVLIDGGVASNLPVDVARTLSPSRVIAVNVSTRPASREAVTSMLGVYQQMVTLLTIQNVKAQLGRLGPSDIVITPDLTGVPFQDFSQMALSVSRGLTAAEQARPSLAPLGSTEADYAAYRQRLVPVTPPPQAAVARVELNPLDHVPENAVRSLFGVQPGEPVNPEALKGGVNRLLATGDFERVSYALKQTAEGTWVDLEAREKPWGPNFVRFGTDLSLGAQGNGAIGLSLGHLRTWANDLGAEWRNDMKLGRQLGFATEWFQPWSVGSPWFASARYSFNRQPRTLASDMLPGQSFMQLDVSVHELHLDMGYQLGNWGELRIGPAWRATRLKSAIGGIPDVSISGEYHLLPADWNFRDAGIGAELVLDRLDNVFFPRRGFRLATNAYVGKTQSADAGQAVSDSDTVRRATVDFQGAYSLGRLTLSPKLILATSRSRNGDNTADLGLGGFKLLSGTPLESVWGSQLRFARLDAYYALREVDLFGRRLYVGSTVELGSVGNADLTTYGMRSVKRAFSTYAAIQTALGPLYAALGKTLGGEAAFYLFLGRP